jgi:predicted permease
MRAALGASRGGLVSSILSETALLCGIGGVLGLVVAVQLLDPFVRLLTNSVPGFPRADNVEVNRLVLGFAIAVTVCTAFVAGMLPALSAWRHAPWAAVQRGRRGSEGGGRETRRAQNILLFVEAALSVTLLVAAGLLTRSFVHLAAIETGVEPERVGFMTIQPPATRYPEARDGERFGQEIVAVLEGLPGVSDVARTDVLPALGGTPIDLIRADDAPPGSQATVAASTVDTDYFTLMRIPVRRGRGFRQADRQGAEPVAVISELLATKLFGADDPLGRTVWVGQETSLQGGRVVAKREERLRVVGVVSDVRQIAVARDFEPILYRPLAQRPRRTQSVAFRATGPLGDVLEMARAAVLTHEPGTLIRDLGELRMAMYRTVAPLRARTVLIVGLAGLAALLTAVGIVGVVAHVVADQEREIGIRMALGAAAGRETGRMIRRALLPTLAGGAVGVGAALGLSRFLAGSLFGVAPEDPLTYGGVFVAMACMAAAAAWVPARRAASVDPSWTLRWEA